MDVLVPSLYMYTGCTDSEIVKICILLRLSTGVQVGLFPASYSVLEGNQVSLTIVKTGTADIPVTVILSSAGKTATGIVTQLIYT